MLLGVGLQRLWHHARVHRFFATARWCADAVGLALLDLIVDRLLPTGSPITVVVDDTQGAAVRADEAWAPCLVDVFAVACPPRCTPGCRSAVGAGGWSLVPDVQV
jgi:hypothetical protein